MPRLARYLSLAAPPFLAGAVFGYAYGRTRRIILVKVPADRPRTLREPGLR